MNPRNTLWAVTGISTLGFLFSGTLSVGELTSGTCPIQGGCGFLWGVPLCLYGFIMFAAILATAAWGLWSSR